MYCRGDVCTLKIREASDNLPAIDAIGVEEWGKFTLLHTWGEWANEVCWMCVRTDGEMVNVREGSMELINPPKIEDFM